jgi:hypothetical protein
MMLLAVALASVGSCCSCGCGWSIELCVRLKILGLSMQDIQGEIRGLCELLFFCLAAGLATMHWRRSAHAVLGSWLSVASVCYDVV